MRLGQTITEIRKERKMTQEEFAQIFHVTRQTVSNWEKEKNQALHQDVWYRKSAQSRIKLEKAYGLY